MLKYGEVFEDCDPLSFGWDTVKNSGGWRTKQRTAGFCSLTSCFGLTMPWKWVIFSNEIQYNRLLFIAMLFSEIPLQPNDFYLSAGVAFVLERMPIQFYSWPTSFCVKNILGVIHWTYRTYSTSDWWLLRVATSKSLCMEVLDVRVELFSRTLTRKNPQRIIISFVSVFICVSTSFLLRHISFP